jgi:tetratricopeptide (TPR) repeat protein
VAELRTFVVLCEDTPQAAEAMARIGDVELERQREDAAVDAYLRVVCADATPSSVLRVVEPSSVAICRPLVDRPDAIATIWARIAQLYFDEPDLPRALASYDAALALTTRSSPLFGMLLYMRAWTLFRADHFGDALEAFAVAAEQGEPERREEALAYLGIIAVELDWDVDRRPDAVTDAARPEVQAVLRRHPAIAPELLWQAGDVCFGQLEWARLLAWDTLSLQRYPGSQRASDVAARMASVRGRM